MLQRHFVHGAIHLNPDFLFNPSVAPSDVSHNVEPLASAMYFTRASV
jgi:hypothetical protein